MATSFPLLAAGVSATPFALAVAADCLFLRIYQVDPYIDDDLCIKKKQKSASQREYKLANWKTYEEYQYSDSST